MAVEVIEPKFLLSAFSPEQFPDEPLPEIAFLGRSNVGKSSLINALIGERGLASTSAEPGCTQAINFYRAGAGYVFADLPGYGYARVSKDRTLEWKKLIESYLLKRRCLELCILTLDSRRGWMESDLELAHWLKVHSRPFLAVATKMDKLKNQSERQKSAAGLGRHPDSPAILCSALTGRGVREIWQAIKKTQRR